MWTLSWFCGIRTSTGFTVSRLTRSLSICNDSFSCLCPSVSFLPFVLVHLAHYLDHYYLSLSYHPILPFLLLVSCVLCIYPVSSFLSSRSTSTRFISRSDETGTHITPTPIYHPYLTIHRIPPSSTTHPLVMTLRFPTRSPSGCVIYR